MPATVRLNDIVDALEMQFDEYSSFLDRETGQVETISNALLREAEEAHENAEPYLPAWQKQEWEIAKRIAEGDASKAIAASNGTNVGGRTVNVNEARPKADPAGSGREGGFRGWSERCAPLVNAECHPYELPLLGRGRGARCNCDTWALIRRRTSANTSLTALPPVEADKHFVVSADLTLFVKYHVGLQEGPALCLKKLSADLETLQQLPHELTRYDLAAYVSARAAAAAERKSSQKRRTF